MSRRLEPTPGPWGVGTSTERDAAPGRVHVLHYGDTGPYRTVAVAKSEADAPLIASAPELLEFVRSVAEYDEYRDDNEPLSKIVARIESRARELMRRLEVCDSCGAHPLMTERGRCEECGHLQGHSRDCDGLDECQCIDEVRT